MLMPHFRRCYRVTHPMKMPDHNGLKTVITLTLLLYSLPGKNIFLDR